MVNPLREVAPFSKDAWVDEAYTDQRDKNTGRLGFEINFNKHFYHPHLPRALPEVQSELQDIQKIVEKLMRELAA